MRITADLVIGFLLCLAAVVVSEVFEWGKAIVLLVCILALFVVDRLAVWARDIEWRAWIDCDGKGLGPDGRDRLGKYRRDEMGDY